jgi:hypothetical protein
MRREMLSFAGTLLYAILLGVTMKIADLLDEHGLRFFMWSDILFGILWGAFGSLLILNSNVLANVMLAMVVAFILRYKIDYLNHGIASSMMLITFLFVSSFEPHTFLPFFGVFTILGLAEDYLSDKSKFKTIVPIRIPFYSGIGAVYALLANYWIVFFSLFLYEISYVITDLLFAYRERTQGSHHVSHQATSPRCSGESTSK